MIAIALMLAQTGPWTKYQIGPYKLVVSSSEGGITTVDYSTSSRCEAAKAVIDAEMERRNKDVADRRAAGEIITAVGWRLRAICIPG